MENLSKYLNLDRVRNRFIPGRVYDVGQDGVRHLPAHPFEGVALLWGQFHIAQLPGAFAQVGFLWWGRHADVQARGLLLVLQRVDRRLTKQSTRRKYNVYLDESSVREDRRGEDPRSCTSTQQIRATVFKAFSEKCLGVMLDRTSKREKARFIPVKPSVPTIYQQK
jgi:hypothetical protein